IPDPRTENPNVTEGLVAVIQRMMAKKADDRYQTPAELLADLEVSSLTRAAFSQEILNAIDDESGLIASPKAPRIVVDADEPGDVTPEASPRKTRGKGRAEVEDVPEPRG